MAEQEPFDRGPENGSGLQVMALNDTKAGMEGLDKEKINKIIEEASRGSKFYQAKSKSQERISLQIQKITDSLSKLTAEDIAKATLEMDRLAMDLESSRDNSRTIVHVDMDAFYAAVEIRDDPSLGEKPMAVGGMGMLSTSNYLARKYGVRAGMPGFIGKKLCPGLVIIPPNFKKYTEVSEVVRGVFKEFDPNFSPMSLDEAYLDITEFLERNEERSAEDVVNEIRSKIETKTSLTASAGIAPNTMLAKVCSDRNKPNGQFLLKPEDIRTFVASLPIRKVSGIGNVTEQMLNAVGVTTCQEMFEKRGHLRLLFSEVSYMNFLRISLGLGRTRLSAWTDRDRKSMSNETTFRDTSEATKLFDICQELSNELSDDLQRHGLVGKGVTVKIKTHDFKIKTRIQTLVAFTSDAGVIHATAKSVLRWLMDNAEEKPLKLRLMGVRMSELKSEAEMSTNKQVTLDQFTTRRKVEDSFECPVCFKCIAAQSLTAFNRHVDQCLMLSGDSASGELSADQGPSTSNESGTDHCPSTSKESSADRCPSDKNTVQSTKMPTETCFRESFECPVCGRTIRVGSEEEAGRHIDECLNKKEISNILQVENSKKKRKSEETVDGSRKASRLKTIDAYFR